MRTTNQKIESEYIMKLEQLQPQADEGYDVGAKPDIKHLEPAIPCSKIPTRNERPRTKLHTSVKR